MALTLQGLIETTFKIFVLGILLQYFIRVIGYDYHIPVFYESAEFTTKSLKKVGEAIKQATSLEW
jgi:hypothetical protein